MRRGIANALANWGISTPASIEMLIEELNVKKK